MAEERQKMPRMAIGDDDFRSFVLDSDIFVDKTILVKEILEAGDKVILITRPRRWGKSLNLSMIGRFVEIEVDREGNLIAEAERINPKLFLGGEVDTGKEKAKRLSPLKISAYQELIDGHLGQFPVIRLSLKEINGDSVGKIEGQLIRKIRELFGGYRYLLSSDNIAQDEKEEFQTYLIGNVNTTTMEGSLKFLSGLLLKHFGKKSYILIDEYDAPINNAYLKLGYGSEEYSKVIDIMRNLFGSALKTNTNLEKGVITGILRIAKANLLSDLNNLTENSLFNEKFSSSYGFTEKEVEELVQHTPLDISLNEIKDWYNGYTFGGQVLYNPWSITQCLNNYGKLDRYWLDSGGTNIIDHVLRSDQVQEDLQRLVTGGSITSRITKYINFDEIETKVGLYSLLLLSGYLNPKVIEDETDLYELSIPNKEVTHIYRDRILQWLKKNLAAEDTQYYFFAQYLAHGKLEEFTSELKKILALVSFYQSGEARAELFYSGFMIAITGFLKPSYIIENEAESGKGRADTILISKSGKGNNAIILEYKVCKEEKDLAKTAEEGLWQINDRNYPAKIRQYEHVKQVIKLSISFYGKMAETAYAIEEIL